MKYILILMMIVISLINADPAADLFLKKPKYFTYKIAGTKHYCFNLENMEILKAKHMVIKDLFLPVTNCYYSNLIQDNEDMAGYIFLLESERINHKKEKILKYSLVAAIAIIIAEGVIITLK